LADEHIIYIAIKKVLLKPDIICLF